MATASLKSTLDTCCPRPLRPYWDRVQRSPLEYRLAKGAFWSVLGAVASRMLVLGASVLVARMLGKNLFGELGVLRSTLEMFGVFAGLSLGVTATKHVAEFRRTNPARAGEVIAMLGQFASVAGGLTVAVFFFGSPWIAGHVLAAEHLGGALQLACPLLLLNALNGVQIGTLSGLEAFKTIARVNVLSGILSFPLVVGLVWWGGMNGAVWGMLLSSSIDWLLYHLALRRALAKAGIPFHITARHHAWGVLWQYSLPATLSSLIVVATHWGCAAMLVNQPGGYGEMGVYSAANQWFMAILFLPGLLGRAALPMLSEQLSRGEARQSRRVLRLSILLNAASVLPIVLLGCLASSWIMAAYSREFAEHWPTLIMALLTGGLLALQIPVGQVITASGRMWIAASINLTWSVCFCGGTYLLLHWGALGMTSARAAAYVVQLVWISILAWQLLKEERNVA